MSLTLDDYKIIFEQRVDWGDMDALGHVNNVIYYRYIENARIYYMDQLNIRRADINTVIASSQCRYLRPTVYPDQLSIGIRIEEIRNSAIRMSYLLYSQQQQQVVAVAEAVQVMLDKHTQQKTPIPDELRQRILALETHLETK
jgi:acyl-CoA thioester hydrolase